MKFVYIVNIKSKGKLSEDNLPKILDAVNSVFIS